MNHSLAAFVHFEKFYINFINIWWHDEWRELKIKSKIFIFWFNTRLNVSVISRNLYKLLIVWKNFRQINTHKYIPIPDIILVIIICQFTTLRRMIHSSNKFLYNYNVISAVISSDKLPLNYIYPLKNTWKSLFTSVLICILCCLIPTRHKSYFIFILFPFL